MLHCIGSDCVVLTVCVVLRETDCVVQTEQTDELEVHQKKPNVTAQKAVQKLVELDRAVVHVSKV